MRNLFVVLCCVIFTVLITVPASTEITAEKAKMKTEPFEINSMVLTTDLAVLEGGSSDLTPGEIMGDELNLNYNFYLAEARDGDVFRRNTRKVAWETWLRETTGRSIFTELATLTQINANAREAKIQTTRVLAAAEDQLDTINFARLVELPVIKIPFSAGHIITAIAASQFFA